MNERLQVINHQGKKILLIDFSRLAGKDFLPLLDDIQKLIAKSPDGSLLTLADFTDAQVDKTVATRMKEVLALDRPHVKRSAWVGTEKLPKVFYENFKTFSQRDFPKFRTREEAIDYLVADQS